jgi:membrane-associated protein
VDLTNTLLEWLTVNGPMTLGVVAFVCALGVPLPIPLLMVATGALIRQGHMHLPAAVLVTAGGALIAELLYYAIGRGLGPLARTRAGARFAAAYGIAESRFRQRPSLTVYLTRWLFPPIGIPVNLIAGSSRFPLERFVFGAVAGNTMWIVGYTAVGYALGNEWRNLSPVFDRYKVYFATAAVVAGLVYLAWRKREAIVRALWRTPVTIPAPLAADKLAISPVAMSDASTPPKR